MNKRTSEWIWIADFDNENKDELTNECKDSLNKRWMKKIMPR